MVKLLFILLLILECHLGLAADEVPRVFHFDEQDYQAHSQNWGISQSTDHRMFFGNSGGLLTFDGCRWRTLQTPSSQIVRTVHADEQGRVFIGGYATMGYWHVNQQFKEEFVSLLDSVELGQEASEEIWHILPLDDGLLFQSFSMIYKYDFKKIEEVKPPGNIMFCRKVDGRVIVPVIGLGLYEYAPNGQFHFIEGSEIFKQQKVATILPIDDGWLVCVQDGGIYIYKNGAFALWETPINRALAGLQLNKGLRLSNGHYAFGTILGGLFLTDAQGNVLHHINQENGLQNNTVLALFEDNMSMLWLGLDRGIDLVDVHSPLLFYHDKSGHIGTVYAAVLYQNRLYVGTNQGIYHKPFPGRGAPFELLNGSQGQVWELKVVDGQLLGGHNSGPFQIKNGKLTFFGTETGAYSLVKHPTRADIMLQGGYVGINVFRRNAAGEWRFAQRLGNYILPVEKLAFDADGKLWAQHPRKGLARLTLDPDGLNVIEVENLGPKQGLPSAFSLHLVQVGPAIYVKSAGRLLRWNNDLNRLEPAPGKGEYLRFGGETDGTFLVFPDKIVWQYGSGSHVLNTSLRQGDEQIVPLSNNFYLLCLDDGFALFSRHRLPEPSQLRMPPPPLVGQVVVNENERGHRSLWPGADTVGFSSTERHLRFYFSQPVFDGKLRLQSKLEGFDTDWTPFGKTFSREFTNLHSGSYRFLVRAENTKEVAVFNFFINPMWYQTGLARALAVLLVAALLLLFYRLHRMRLKRHIAKLLKETELELHHLHTQAENRMLQSEVLNKSRKLADTTMNLVRKNEMLIRLKEELDHATRQKDGDPTQKALTKMEHLIEAHLTDEEDWQIFESNFNQLHDQFFKRLKEQYPELTPGDLRIAAYLKMNLSSKEIAPLLNISVRGVENKRYRLRQKMGLDGEVNLTEYLMGY